ncbi:MAG: major capsid protein [Microvirus sp.]|nr:MAG: major capsid protein [Microvirus sp.]
MAKQNFAQVPKAEIARSSFDRSHGHKTTLNEGYLYPVFVDEALPGDTFNLKMHAVARLSTPIFPIMDNIYFDTHFFAVPYRLVWDNWEKFNGSQVAPGDSTDFTIPIINPTAAVIAVGGIGDYMGLPIGAMPPTVSALPFRAYSLIWNEWFRDENLQAPNLIQTGDGPDNWTQYGLSKRGKRHDYFTSCLPWPQKGAPADVPIVPLGTAPVPTFRSPAAGINTPTPFWPDDVGSYNVTFQATHTGVQPFQWADPALGITINTLRQAYQVQRILERDARGGTRYTELIKAHFGVTSPDARLQRPEYLGGFSQPINIAQIHQSSGTGAAATPYTDTALGQVGGIGTIALSGEQNGFTHSFTEHCIVMGFISIRADMTYQQKLDRMWSRRTRFDFFWPALAHIGEQAVLAQELYYGQTGGDALNQAVFGYQERYGEYRFKSSQVTGEFRSVYPQTLDAWHLAYDYTDHPGLNSTFIQESPPISRVVAVPSEPHFIADMWFDLRCARPMPTYGVPGMSDHF